MKLALPYPILPPSARSEAAQRLGITADEVGMILCGRRGWLEDRLVDGTAFDGWKHEDLPTTEAIRHAGAGVLPADLLVHEIDVPRDPGRRLDPPISPVDVVATEILWLGQHLDWAQRNRSPRVAALRSAVQRACEEILLGSAPWGPSGQREFPLSAGRPVSWAPAPQANLYNTAADAVRARSCDFWAEGYLVQFGFAAVLLGTGGEVRDLFPASGLRVLGSDARHLVLSGAGTRFSPSPYLRDVIEHRWSDAPIPAGLPHHTAGVDINGMPMAVDLARGVAWNLRPRASAFTHTDTARASACGRFVWDSTTFVQEAATGRAVLDARWVPGDAISYAATSDGWRFLMSYVPADDEPEDPSDVPWLRLLSDTEVVRELDPQLWDLTGHLDSPMVLSPNGEHLLDATGPILTVTQADTGRPVGPGIDLRPLARALELPEDTDLWVALASLRGIPAALAAMTPEAVLDELGDWMGYALPEAGITRDDIVDALQVAAARPALPRTLPLLDVPGDTVAR